MAFNPLSIILPKKKAKKGGTGYTGTYDPNSTDGVITVPLYRDHLTDIFSSRQSFDSRTLLKDLMKHDPDMSAATNAYLTLANTEPVIVARTVDEEIDREATKQVYRILRALTSRYDYSQGFQLKPKLETITELMRSMILLRGAVVDELVLDDQLMPSELRLIDPATVEWVEKKPGIYKPQQAPPGSNDKINLDLPSVFASFYRRDPTGIYSYSPFVSAINTIAARQQVINDLYRIMRITGYPRLSVKVLEEVVVKNMPANVKTDPEQYRAYMQQRLNEVATIFSNPRVDQIYIHWDSAEPQIINDKKPGATADISKVIETLNSQNQAGLKTMATVIGRGESGVNTASVEARIAAMNADAVNVPVAEILSDTLTFSLAQSGYQGFVDVYFRSVEMRQELELEPQLTMKAARLKEDLSLGIISDDDYHLEMYGRIRPDSAPELSGTNFMQAQAASVDTSSISPNSDPLGRSLTPSGSKTAKSNTVKRAA